MTHDKLKRSPTRGTRRGNGTGWGGPANGCGWGGPAKGAAFYPSKGHSGRILTRRAADETRRDALCKIYYDIATDESASTALRIVAASHLLNRIEGLAVAKSVTPLPDPISLLTDEELDAEIDRLRKRVQAAEEARQDGSAPACRDAVEAVGDRR